MNDPLTETNDRPQTVHRLRRRRILRAFLAVSLALTAALLFSFRRPIFEGNRGVVDEGLVYRAAQPTGDVVGLIRAKGLASIVNLRGGGSDDSWYAAEVEAARAANVDFYDLPMSATKRPTRRELLVLLDLFARCKYPLLIHCKSGADRTGLASALYLMSRRGVDPARAEAAFTLSHAHVPLFGPEHLHEPFQEYAAWLAANGLDHTPERLIDWVRNQYRADDPPVAMAPVRPGPRVRRQAANPAEPTTRR